MQYAKQFVTSEKFRSVRVLLIYVVLALIVTGILFWRFPNNVTTPNFYGEDGSVYLQNIINEGWLKGSLSPFNGYSIIGLYLICGLGWVINLIFMGGSLLTLSQAFAVAAIVFMAAIIALPYLLFRRNFGSLQMLAVVGLSAFIPLPTSPHIVIGTIGNQKWIFLYLAFLLVLYRIINYRRLGWRRIVTIDAILLVSAYTNSTVYLLMPALLLPYLQDYLKNRRPNILQFGRKQLRNFDIKSLTILFALLVPQVVYVALNGIPKLAGYLDTPFNPERAIELFINRTYLFSATHYINAHMNNLISVLFFILMLVIAAIKLRGNQLVAFILGIYAAGVASLLFVINRPGVTDHVFGYSANGSGPDQFFYVQTLIMYIPLVLACWALFSGLKKWRLQHILPIGILILVLITSILSNARFGERWRNASVYENDAGIFTDQAIQSCKVNIPLVTMTVYPYKSGQFALTVPREQVCNRLLDAYRSSIDDLGLRVNNNDHLPITQDGQFYQTFKASENDLNGIRIFVSSFGKLDREGVYTLQLMDKDCRQIIRESRIPTKLIDNYFFNARFDEVINSSGKSYCFTLDAPSGSFDPIAIQRSQPDVYADGVLRESDVTHASDTVFAPLYSSVRD